MALVEMPGQGSAPAGGRCAAHAQLDRLLLALRASGGDSYRADPDRIGAYDAYCLACASHMLDARRLRIVEGADGRVRMTCAAGCRVQSVLIALHVAERCYPARWVGGPECPAYQAAVVELLLDQAQAERRVVAAIQREAA